jgi:pimeloyl-ACP methyl ester carboxylesterase
MPYVQVNHHKLFYAHSRATPEHLAAPPLVLLHGSGGNHLHWPGELRRLPGATVYALDLPGHGRSDGSGYDAISAYVEILLGFLGTIGVQRAVLAGHSMGSAIAQMTALTYPERVAGLALMGAGARLRVHPAILEGILDDFENTVDLVTRWLWAEDAPQELVRLSHQALAATPASVIHGDYVACDRFDVMDRLGEISAPTLVIAGTADKLTPLKYGAYLAERIPNARLITVEGGGHMMALEQPAIVAEAIAEFVRGL